MQAFSYIRVSTDEQTHEGVSLAGQETRLQAHCTAVEERDERL